LNKKSIYLCPSCWEVKKNNYKELLKEDVLKETIIQYKRYGYIDWQELDKNDEQIVSQVLVHKQELGQEKTDAPNSWEISHSISFTVCWGCDKWMEEKNEDHSNCQEIIAEKSEFEILKKRENKPQEGFLLNSREKQRLIELRNKYSKKQSNETTEDKQKKIVFSLFSTKQYQIS